MKLTRAKLLKLKPCTEGLDWYDSKKEIDLAKICKLLLADDQGTWANWLLVRLMSKKQKVQFAVFAAEKVIDIFEKKYPNDKRPREAIEAAKKWIKSPTVANKKAAYAAARAAANAAYAAAYVAHAAARAAANAAYAAAYVAHAADAVYAAYAAYAAADAANRKKLQAEIVNYGLKLIETRRR